MYSPPQAIWPPPSQKASTPLSADMGEELLNAQLRKESLTDFTPSRDDSEVIMQSNELNSTKTSIIKKGVESLASFSVDASVLDILQAAKKYCDDKNLGEK